MKTEKLLHWHIYIYCRLKRFIIKLFISWFQIFIFVLSAQTDSQYYLSSFYCSQTQLLKNSFLFLPARPVGKLTPHVLTSGPGLRLMQTSNINTVAEFFSTSIAFPLQSFQASKSTLVSAERFIILIFFYFKKSGMPPLNFPNI